MGGAVSSGRDNNELVDNLMGGNYIRSRHVEQVFRAVDRADYMLPEARDQAYKDLAWKSGPLHLSAPCIYSEVMESLELRKGLSFLNVGSGTGYLSTLVGLIIGAGGVSHGIEIHPTVFEYCNKRLGEFMENSPVVDELDYCIPKYFLGNGLCLAPLQSTYDRVYCGVGCPDEFQNYFKHLIKVGGILVMPLNENLVQVRRVSESEWSTHSVLQVSFAQLRVPSKTDAADLIRLEEIAPAPLQQLSRAAVRAAMRRSLLRAHPELRAAPRARPPRAASCPRRICIPLEDDGEAGWNELHDLDSNTGANEMNALLSLVLNMGQNRVAGSLRFDPIESSGSSGTETEPEDDTSDDDDDAAAAAGDRDPAEEAAPPAGDAEPGPARGDPDPDGAGDPEPGASGDPRPDAGREDADSRSDDAKSKSGRRDKQRFIWGGKSLPSEVEICIGKETTGESASTSRGRSSEMEWEDEAGAPEAEAARGRGAAAAGGARAAAGLKLDSGIGEENSPETSSSSAKTESRSEGSEAEAPGAAARGAEPPRPAVRWRITRAGKRSRGAARAPSSDSSDGCGAALRPRHKRRASAEERAAERERARGRARRPGRRAPPADDGRDARRGRLSALMRRAAGELPLPCALKKYVNYGRRFEF